MGDGWGRCEVGVGREHGWGTGGRGRGGGGSTALRTMRPEWAASTDPSARTAPRRGRKLRCCQSDAAAGTARYLGVQAGAWRIRHHRITTTRSLLSTVVTGISGCIICDEY